MTRPLTNQGNAERLVDQHKDIIRYVPEWGWMVQDGTRWKLDSTHDANNVVTLAVQTVREMGKEAYEQADKTLMHEMAKHALASESQYSLLSMPRLAQKIKDVQESSEEFDKNKWLLNTANKTVNLQTGKPQAHSSRDMITRVANVVYDADAKAPTFEKFISDIMGGNPDMVNYLQRVLGYILTGFTTEHKFFMAWGKGRNGKSTLFNLLSKILGEFAETPSTEMILKSGDGRSKPRYDMAELPGKRLILISEIEEGRKLDVALVKAMSGGDKVSAKKLYHDPFSFYPDFKLVIMTNNKPEIGEMSPAIWERVKAIPFLADFSDSNPNTDHELPTKLEQELSGILNWLIAGCLMWQEEGLREPEQITQATQEYMGENDPMGNYRGECLVENAQAETRASQLFDAYRWWFEFKEETGQMLTETRFFTLLGQNYKKKRTSKGNVYVGIRLNEDTIDGMEDEYRRIHNPVNMPVYDTRERVN